MKTEAACGPALFELPVARSAWNRIPAHSAAETRLTVRAISIS